MQTFRDYYFEQRHLQLMSDLSPPGSMLENHRAYLTHIAGAPPHPPYLSCLSSMLTVMKIGLQTQQIHSHRMMNTLNSPPVIVYSSIF